MTTDLQSDDAQSIIMIDYIDVTVVTLQQKPMKLFIQFNLFLNKNLIQTSL